MKKRAIWLWIIYSFIIFNCSWIVLYVVGILKESYFHVYRPFTPPYVPFGKIIQKFG